MFPRIHDIKRSTIAITFWINIIWNWYYSMKKGYGGFGLFKLFVQFLSSESKFFSSLAIVFFIYWVVLLSSFSFFKFNLNLTNLIFEELYEWCLGNHLCLYTGDSLAKAPYLIRENLNQKKSFMWSNFLRRKFWTIAYSHQPSTT